MIKNLFDKLFFAAGVIVFLQLPHFINQYAQRLGGYVDSHAEQLANHQSIANEHFAGDLSAYIDHLKKQNDPAIADGALQIERHFKQQHDMAQELTVFQSEPTWYLVPYFITHPRLSLVKGTAQQFQPGLPINLWAWLYGLLGGLLFSLLFHGGCAACVSLARSNKKKQFSVN